MAVSERELMSAVFRVTGMRVSCNAVSKLPEAALSQVTVSSDPQWPGYGSEPTWRLLTGDEKAQVRTILRAGRHEDPFKQDN